MLVLLFFSSLSLSHGHYSQDMFTCTIHKLWRNSVFVSFYLFSTLNQIFSLSQKTLLSKPLIRKSSLTLTHQKHLSSLNFVTEPNSLLKLSTNCLTKFRIQDGGHKCRTIFKVSGFSQNFVETKKNLKQLNEMVCSIEAMLKRLSTM